MARTPGKKKFEDDSLIGKAIGFTQTRVGDTIRVGKIELVVSQKCDSEHFVVVTLVSNPHAEPFRVTEFEFTKYAPVLVKE